MLFEEFNCNRLDGDAFDAYIVSKGYCNIQRVSVMEDFLLCAAKRFHVLDKELSSLEGSDVLPNVKQKAWEFLSDQFTLSISDLRMWFSETEDYYEQSPEGRKRLNAIADALVCSGRDESKIVHAQLLSNTEEKPWYVPDVFTQKHIDDLTNRIQLFRVSADGASLTQGYHVGTMERCNHLAKQNRTLATELWEKNAPPDLKEKYRSRFLGPESKRPDASEEIDDESTAPSP